MSADAGVTPGPKKWTHGTGGKILGGLFALAYIVIAWSVYYLWCRFQLVQTQPIDYLMLAALGFGVPLLLLARKARQQGRPLSDLLSNTAARKPLFGGVILVALLGGAALRTINGLLDPHSRRLFAATILDSSCRHGLVLRGAPTLPTTTDSMSVELFALDNTCLHAHVGDTVLVSIGAGLLGRPWIAAYHVRPLPDVAQQALERHRALMARLRAQPR